MSAGSFIDDRELPEVRYRNEYVKKWSEVGAALRYRLRIEERDAYDAVASADSPEPLKPGDFVEVKACKRWVENGDEYGTSGRWHITESSHDRLLDIDGYYCLIVYDLVSADGGGDRINILGIRLVHASEVDEELFRRGSYDSHRLGYKPFFPEIHPSSDDPRERVKSKAGESRREPAEETEANGSEPPEPPAEPASVPENGPGLDKAISEAETYPDSLKEFDIWLVWCYDSAGRKVPRAPWKTDTCYPVPWGADTEARPETDFEEAHRFAGFGAEIEHQWPFPGDADDKDLKLGMLLPHEPPEPPIMQIDLDNVRCPETGRITEEASEIIDAFPDAYGIVSTSGTGIHLYVRAGLPGSRGKFIEPLGEYEEPAFETVDDELPQIEMYDHGRFVAMTGQHIEGTGEEVPAAQERVNDLVAEYETEDDSDLSASDDTFDPEEYRDGNSSSNSANSPYFSHPLDRFGKPKANGASTGEGFGGAHPGHGGTASPDSESTNYAVNVSDNVWHCFAHGSGGGPLSLVAVMEDELDCRTPNLSILSDENFLRVCLLARDKHGFSGDPPYRAVRGVARKEGLAMADYDEGILGRDCWEIARQIYEHLDASDV